MPGKNSCSMASSSPETEIDYDTIQGRDALFGEAATEREFVKVAVKGFGSFNIKVLFEDERFRFEQEIYGEDGEGPEAFRKKLIAKTVCDEQGNLLVGEDEESRLGQINGRLAAALFTAAFEANGFNKEDRFEDEVKNS